MLHVHDLKDKIIHFIYETKTDVFIFDEIRQ